MDTMNNPLISFNAEAENGAIHQAADPAKMRYERMCNEAQLDIDKEVPPPPVAIYIGDLLPVPLVISVPQSVSPRAKRPSMCLL